MNRMKKWFMDKRLQRQNKKWGLYENLVEEIEVVYTFAFIDQLSTSGHFNTQIINNKDRLYNKSIINLNLNNRVTEGAIIHIINHECLHVAICTCLSNQDDDFIEKVINEWVLGKNIVMNGFKGDIVVKDLHI